MEHTHIRPGTHLKHFQKKNKGNKRNYTRFTPKSLNLGKLPAEVGFVRVHTPPLGPPSPPTRANRLQEAGCPRSPPLRLGRPRASQREPQRSAGFRPGGRSACWAPGHLTPLTPPPGHAHHGHTPTPRPLHPLREAVRAQATGARGPRTPRAAPAGPDQSEGREPTWAARQDAHCSVCGHAVNHGVSASA